MITISSRPGFCKGCGELIIIFKASERFNEFNMCEECEPEAMRKDREVLNKSYWKRITKAVDLGTEKFLMLYMKQELS